MEKRIGVFLKLRDFLEDYLTERKRNHYSLECEQLDKLIPECYAYNGWFTPENIRMALEGIVRMLDESSLRKFALDIKEPLLPKTVAVIMAGNIPLVGFHDFLSVLLSGNRILIKPATDDTLLITFLAECIQKWEPTLKDNIFFAEGRLFNFDAVIATGSNNSALYFEKYFGKYPHIIRKNRTSVAVLSGLEGSEDLRLLGQDVFSYFGLGCRNVSKLYVPKGYDFNLFYESIFSYSDSIQNKKYGNNHEYNRAIYLLNQEKFLDNNFLILRESNQLHSPIAVLFYEYYERLDRLIPALKKIEEELQCIVTDQSLPLKTIAFGKTQIPSVFDFSDNINTLDFLNNLIVN